MKYLIDHSKTVIHEVKFVESRCEVSSVTEATDSAADIKNYEIKNSYIQCPYCRSIEFLID